MAGSKRQEPTGDGKEPSGLPDENDPIGMTRGTGYSAPGGTPVNQQGTHTTFTTYQNTARNNLNYPFADQAEEIVVHNQQLNTIPHTHQLVDSAASIPPKRMRQTGREF